MPNLKHLSPKDGSYRCDELDGYVVRTSAGWHFQARNVMDASITVVDTAHQSVSVMDQFIGAVLETPIPHTKLRKANTGKWCYEPWRMVIEIAEFNPRWGNTFKGRYRLANGHFDLDLNRLRHLRAFLRHVKACQESSIRPD